MIRPLMTCLALLFAMALTAQETRNLDAFDEVAAKTGINVILVEGNSNKAIIETENCEPEEVITEISGDELTIKFENSGFWRSSRNRKATVTVHYRSLESIDVSSGAHISANNPIRSEELDLDASSGGHMELKVMTNVLTIDASSGGMIQTEGNARQVDCDVSSGGHIKGYDLIADEVTADASSGGSVSFTVNESLVASASSGGSVNYKGKPTRVKVDASISGSIKSRE